MDFISAENLKAYLHLIILGALIFGLLVFFIFQISSPFTTVKRDLNQAIQAIKNLKSTTGNGQPNKH